MAFAKVPRSTITKEPKDTVISVIGFLILLATLIKLCLTFIIVGLETAHVERPHCVPAPPVRALAQRGVWPMSMA